MTTTWQTYLNKSGRSPIRLYELKGNGINLTFKNGAEYFYPIDRNSTQTIGEMMSLADNGEYLARYLNKHRDEIQFDKGVNTDMPPPEVDSRPLNDTLAKALTEKFMKRNPSVADQLRAAKWKKLQNSENYNNWKNIRRNG